MALVADMVEEAQPNWSVAATAVLSVPPAPPTFHYDLLAEIFLHRRRQGG